MKIPERKRRLGMFAYSITAPIQETKIDEATKFHRENIILVAKLQKGFLGAYLLFDHKRTTGVAITFWDCEENAIANEMNGYYIEQVTKFIEYFTTAPVTEGYEVINLEGVT
ncbi:hypothetical protein ACFLWS_02140 [Chloroflexota bacterium]